MGPGKRFAIYKITGGVGLGVFIGTFPYAVSISINLIIVGISLNFGKSYIED